MTDRQIEFLKELRALLEKYNASIDIGSNPYDDWHGVSAWIEFDLEGCSPTYLNQHDQSVSGYDIKWYLGGNELEGDDDGMD